MPRYEYKVVPAPAKGLKAKGVRGPEARFSHALEQMMNGLAQDGWEFQRAETLPSVERAGIASATTEWRNVLVFRRLRADDAAAFHPELLAAPQDRETYSNVPDAAKAGADALGADAPDSAPVADNGVEDTQSTDTVGSSLNILARVRKLARPQKTAPTKLPADKPDEPQDPKG